MIFGKIRICSGNAFYHSVRNGACTHIKTEIVPVILRGCEIWCLMSREEHRLRVCESRVVRRMFNVRGSYE